MTPTESHSSSRWESLLPRFSLDRRITVLVLFATLLVVGGIASSRIPLELIPQGFENPFLRVDVPWRDAPAQEVLDKITLPLEEELSTVAGLDNLRSSSSSGIGRAFLSFKNGTDMDVAYREVRDRVERARVRMPPDVDQVFIRKEDASGIPIYMLGLAVDESVTDVYNLVQNEVILPLSRIEGVATVQADGLEENEILIELDRQATEAAGLNIYDLAQSLGDDSFTMASGSVYDAGSKLTLRSIAQYGSIEELENRLVNATTRLGDIASIRYDQPDRNYRVRAMSRPAIAVFLLKEGEANTLEVAERAAAVADELAENPKLALIEMVPIFDQGEIIKESLSTLLDSGRIGAIFAIVVLFFFLRRIRMTLIITLSIPLSILIALCVMYFAGETLNILTLLGLMISVGLLVDNSVVVAENIFRLHREGESRRDACVRGAGEIALAVVMATLTTIVVFLPVSLVEGQGQFFLLRLSVPISVSLAGSLLVALVFVPLCVYLTLPSREQLAEGSTPGLVHRVHGRVNGVVHRLYDLSFGWVNQGYVKQLDVFLGRRLELVCILLLVVAPITGAAMKARGVEITDVQEEERAGFELDVQMPPTTTLEEAEEYFLEAEKVVESMADELDLDGWFLFHRTTFGELQGWFKSPRTNDLSPREVTERVVDALPERPGFEIFTAEERQNQDREQEAVANFTLYGEDAEQLEEFGERLEDLLVSVDGVLGLKKRADQRPSELGLVIDRDRAQAQAVNPQTIAGVIGNALRGQALPKYNQDGKEIPVRIRFKEEDRETLAQLSDFQVPTDEGSQVSLTTVTDVRYLASSRIIFRDNKRVAYSVSLDLESGEEKGTRRRLAAMMSSIDLPEGITLSSGRSARSNEDLENMRFAALVSVVFIYLLMGFLFESFILPLSILATIPLASFGVIWAHIIVGLDIDFLGVVGIILLIGVVVNNGIVLIDYINRLRKEGWSRRAAVLHAAERRFRPIMMTALTTICGLIPVTLAGSSSIGMSYKSFGLTLIGGLTTATGLTLLVVPVLYTLVDDLRVMVARLLSRRRGVAAMAPATEPGEAPAG